MSDATEVCWLTVRRLSRALVNGEISIHDLVNVFLARAAEFNPASKAFIDVYADSARAHALKLAEQPGSGMLYGIPYGLKDLIDIRDLRTSAGSAVFADNIASEDAHVVSQLTAAGAVCLGKLNLHEFAYGATGENARYGTAVNAYDSSRLAGGSSSGSAAAVAWGLSSFALGTDTGGSVRSPAALSGLVGLKPTYGRISMRGVTPYSWSLDHLGILSRDVRDCAVILQTLAEPDLADPGSTNRPTDQYLPEVDLLEDLTGRNIGVPRQFFYEHVDPEILSATERVISFLEKKGATVREVETPDLNFSRTVSLTIQMPEALSFHMPWLEKRAGDYGEDFRTGLALGQQILAEHYVRAKRLMTHYRTQIDDVLETVDILVTPSTPIVAPKVGAVEVETEGLTEPVGNAMMRFTNFFNITGHPAISIPSGMHSLGLPMGVQLVGKAFGEASLLAFAHLINSHRQFKLPLPKIN